MRNRVPIVYLVDSAGVNLPLQDGIFPGQYGAARIFYYNSLMRRKLRVPQIAAVMGPCIAGRRVSARAFGLHHHGGKDQLHGPGRAEPGQGRDRRSGGRRIARRRAACTRSRAAWRTTRPPTTAPASTMIRQKFRELPPAPDAPRGDRARAAGRGPVRHPARQPSAALRRAKRSSTASSTRGDYLEFQPEYAPEMLCAEARLAGRPVGLIANRRGFLKTPEGPRVGGIVYTESARKVAYFVEMAERQGLPLIYLQDVSGFMVGVEAEAGRHHPRRRGDGGERWPAPRCPRSC